MSASTSQTVNTKASATSLTDPLVIDDSDASESEGEPVKSVYQQKIESLEHKLDFTKWMLKKQRSRVLQLEKEIASNRLMHEVNLDRSVGDLERELAMLQHNVDQDYNAFKEAFPDSTLSGHDIMTHLIKEATTREQQHIKLAACVPYPIDTDQEHTNEQATFDTLLNHVSKAFFDQDAYARSIEVSNRINGLNTTLNLVAKENERLEDQLNSFQRKLQQQEDMINNQEREDNVTTCSLGTYQHNHVYRLSKLKQDNQPLLNTITARSFHESDEPCNKIKDLEWCWCKAPRLTNRSHPYRQHHLMSYMRGRTDKLNACIDKVNNLIQVNVQGMNQEQVSAHIINIIKCSVDN